MISFPFTSQVTFNSEGQPIYDRASNSKEQRKWNNLLYTDGVDYRKSTAFQVMANSGMSVNVLGDGAWCKVAGAFGYEDQISRTLTVQASESLDRIDRVVLRNDFSTNKRAIDIYVLKGIAATTPQPPTLTKNSTVHEIALADIFISKNTTSIPQNRITDLRLNSYLCGTLGHALNDVDFSPYFLQLQTLIEDYKANSAQSLADLQDAIDNIVAGTGEMLKVAYDTNNSGVVDDSEKLGGQLPNYYATSTQVNNAQSSANSAQSTANSAQSTANSAQSTANNAMPRSGGALTGVTTVPDTNHTYGLRNIQIRPKGSGGWGADISTGNIYMSRK